ncbi:nicotinate-nucleotide pyrophosphorylase [carboxylating] [Porphyromonadaceae bacterium KH3CP3RA]|nr:nicotinate-nucleotide pyrophosphorylase [carboxylating] [Porphyromonadaceae bacterium KH3CP3RA]
MFYGIAEQYRFSMTEKELIHNLIRLAFAEDIGDGDHTTLCSIPETEEGQSRLLIKEEGVLAGVDIAIEVFHTFDPALQVEIFLHDGSHVKPGDVAFVVSGKIRSILQTERLVLNIMQRMSGIATITNSYMKLLEGTAAKVLDTRKTTPGMRILEKQAVRIGGGENHRIGLFDMILLKDNHVDFAGGIEKAIRGAQNYLKEKNKKLKIEVEVRTLDELEEALRVGGVDRIMLDNFTPAQTFDAVKIVKAVNEHVELESSGGITIDTIREYAETGVDYISVGALTHSVKSLDMSLKAI